VWSVWSVWSSNQQPSAIQPLQTASPRLFRPRHCSGETSDCCRSRFGSLRRSKRGAFNDGRAKRASQTNGWVSSFAQFTESTTTPTHSVFRRSKLDTVAGFARRIFLCRGACSWTVRNNAKWGVKVKNKQKSRLQPFRAIHRSSHPKGSLASLAHLVGPRRTSESRAPCVTQRSSCCFSWSWSWNWN